MDEAMRVWTNQAARGECGWVCADCCGTDNRGMPPECLHGQQFCTDINQRDRKSAWTRIFEAQSLREENSQYYFRDIDNPTKLQYIDRDDVGNLTGKWLPYDSTSAEYIPLLIQVK